MNLKKTGVILVLLLFSLTGYGQISGDVVKDNRKLLTNQSFVLEGNHTGVLVFRIAVDEKGAISSAEVLDDQSTIRSTPSKINAYNYVKTFKFEPGTWFPKYHQGQIAITMVKPK